jgi:hypothetical protein
MRISVLGAALVLFAGQSVPSFGQSRQQTAAAILAQSDSPANWTHGRPFVPERPGPSVTILGGRPEDGPFGPLTLTPIEPLSRQPYVLWPAPFWPVLPAAECVRLHPVPAGPMPSASSLQLTRPPSYAAVPSRAVVDVRR